MRTAPIDNAGGDNPHEQDDKAGDPKPLRPQPVQASRVGRFIGRNHVPNTSIDDLVRIVALNTCLIIGEIILLTD